MEQAKSSSRSAAASLAAPNDFFMERPDYQEGYDEKSKTVVRLVSNRHSRKNKKAYKVTNIEDVASKNNWKAWLYLAPAIIAVVIFLVYPLINTIFISFLDNYNYTTGSFSGLTLSNFGMILGLTTYNGVPETNFVNYAIPNTFHHRLRHRSIIDDDCLAHFRRAQFDQMVPEVPADRLLPSLRH
jgi:hypothetical protein